MRNRDQIVQELMEINRFVMCGIPDADLPAMLQTLSTLVTFLAGSAAMVAESGRLYNQAKLKAYNSLGNVKDENGKPKPPSLIKEYIGAMCAEDGYAYELANRVNASVTHALDACRTSISAEKSLAFATNFSQTA